VRSFLGRLSAVFIGVMPMVRLNRLFRDWRGQKTKKPLQTRGKGLQRLNRMKMTRTLCYRSPQAIEWYASRARSMEGSEKWWQKVLHRFNPEKLRQLSFDQVDAADFGMPVAVDQVIVDHTDSLHEGIAYC